MKHFQGSGDVEILDPQEVIRERDKSQSMTGSWTSGGRRSEKQGYIDAAGLTGPLARWRANRKTSLLDGIYKSLPELSVAERRQIQKIYDTDQIDGIYENVIKKYGLPKNIKVGDKTRPIEVAIRDPGVWRVLRDRYEGNKQAFMGLAVLEFTAHTHSMGKAILGKSMSIDYMTPVTTWQEKLTTHFDQARIHVEKKWKEANSENGVLTTTFKKMSDNAGSLWGYLKRQTTSLRQGFDKAVDGTRQYIDKATASPPLEKDVEEAPSRLSGFAVMRSPKR